jgi:hypothetical protein
MLNAGMVNGAPHILCRSISANFLPIQADFCVCRIPLNMPTTFELTDRVHLPAGAPVDYAHNPQ